MKKLIKKFNSLFSKDTSGVSMPVPKRGCFSDEDVYFFVENLTKGAMISDEVYLEKGARSNHAKKIDESIVEWFNGRGYKCIQGDNRPTMLDVKRTKEYDMGFPGTPVLIESKTCHDSYQKNHKNHINPLVGEDYVASKHGYKLNHVFILWSDCAGEDGIDPDYMDATNEFLKSVTEDGHNWLWAMYNRNNKKLTFPFCTQPNDFLNHENFTFAKPA
jgi:hypothetical protein